ncbi:MAG: glycoside hydrolase family 3 N-terminal domain-containing protein [Candidatus Hadarchaeum sp.]
MRKLAVLIAVVLGLGGAIAQPLAQPEIEARVSPILEIDGLKFKDLNKNGVLDPYEDWRLPVDVRVEDLLSKMTLEEKVGQMLHPNVNMPADGSIVGDQVVRFGNMTIVRPGPATLIARGVGYMLNNGVAHPIIFASWSNKVQEIAEGTRLGIPILFSSDPRHGAVLAGHVTGKQYFSGWPKREGFLGMAATMDLDLIRRYGEIVAAEYRAVGLHMILGPIVDVMTEPRWTRNGETWGENAEMTAKMAAAFIQGAQGEKLGPTSIATMPKHWPGSGPQDISRSTFGGAIAPLAYPGNNFAYHLLPFKAAFEAGAFTTMCYYSPNPFDGCGSCYSQYLNKVLREELGFTGINCTDWGVMSFMGPVRADLQSLPRKEWYALALEAGVDQFGGESDPTPILELVREGRISEERINESVRKLLKLKFELGLFENPYVDPLKAEQIVGNEKFQADAYRAQLESVVLLKNSGVLPLPEAVLDITPSKVSARRARIYVNYGVMQVPGYFGPEERIVGIDPKAASQYATVVNDPKDADYIILELEVGSIELTPEQIQLIDQMASVGVPVILVLNFNRAPVVLTPELVQKVDAILATFDILDNALLDVVFGRFNPVGKLPFQIPSSLESVEKQLPDVPFDLENPMFDYGFGLSY